MSIVNSTPNNWTESAQHVQQDKSQFNTKATGHRDKSTHKKHTQIYITCYITNN